MNARKLVVRIQNVYGERRIYPVCPTAKAFAEVAGTRTLTPHVINIIKSMGYTFIREVEAI